MNDLRARLEASLSASYRLERELGSGGMAVVYLAQDLRHKRRVALKVLRPEISAVMGPERFLREIETLANLTHPHILPLHDSGEADGLLYYVMPYVDGESLRERLVREKQLPLDDALRIAREVADALSHAHGRGVIHRDIKPENILLSGGHALVADFGIAAAIDVAGGSRLTETGIAMGTPAYMSPEQALGERTIDPRADVYALGCVLYEMLAGEPPFTGPTAQVLLARKLHDPVPTLRNIRELVPETIDQAIRQALARAPADRFAIAEGFVEALSYSAVDRREHRWSSHRIRLAAATTTLAILLVGALSLLLLNRRQPSMPAGPAPAIAILPFDVRGGEEVTYLREGIVNLLATKLGTTEQLRSVDVHALLKYVASDGAFDPRRGKEIAGHFSAGHFLLGTVVVAGTGRLHIDASLYQTDRADALEQESVEGSADDLSLLVDELAGKLLAGLLGTTRLSTTAALTTESLPALKAYLEGERLLRAGEPAQAVAKLREAVTLDSTFALAHFRLAFASGWQPPWQFVVPAATAALRHRDRLSSRDQNMVRITHMAMTGDPAAEPLMRQHLARYPDDLDTWFLLGDWLFHIGPGQGKPIGLARPAFEMASKLDPNDASLIRHRLEIASAEGRVQERDSLLESLPSLQFRAARAFANADLRAEQQEVLTEFNTHPLSVAIPRDLLILGSNDAVEQIVPLFVRRVNAENLAPAQFVGAIHVLFATGHMADVRRVLVEYQKVDPNEALVLRAYLAVLPFLPVQRSELIGIQERLLRWNGRTGATADSTLRAIVPDSLGSQVRTYLLGLIALRLGHASDVLRLASDLDRQSRNEPVRAIATDYASSLRAQLRWQEKRPREALQLLDASDRETNARRYLQPYALTLHSVLAPPFIDRFIRAEVLFDSGQFEEAFAWYAGFTEMRGLPPVLFAAISHLRRAQISEKRGQRDETIRHALRVLAILKDADPEFNSIKDTARQLLQGDSGK